MVLDRLKDIVRPDATYTYRCNDCGENWESKELRHGAECPECGGPPRPASDE